VPKKHPKSYFPNQNFKEPNLAEMAKNKSRSLSPSSSSQLTHGLFIYSANDMMARWPRCVPAKTRLR
jgi:hypothetical protein